MTSIYRIEIWCSGDIDTEYHSYVPLSDFYLNKDDAEESLEKMKKLNPKELAEIYELDSDTFISNTPMIIEYNLID